MTIATVSRRSGISPTYLEEFREKYQPLKYQPPRQYKNASRYKNLRTIQDAQTGSIFHENWIQKIIDKSAQDQYFTVTLSEKDRLDIISNNYYSTPRYWWVIAIANSIIDPFDVPIGTALRIPPIISLYNKGGVLSGS